MQLGTYFPEGGMAAISASLYRLAIDCGVESHLGEAVERIEYAGSQVKGVVTSRGSYEADVVVCNRDVFSAYRTLLPDVPAPEKILQQERSSSGIIFYWGIKQLFKQLHLHNIFFSENYEREFHALFEEKTMPEDPTVYVNITSKLKADDAPEGCENWFVMVNAPTNVGQDWDRLIAETRERVINKLSNLLGCSIADLIMYEEVLEPRKLN
jgi:phytoene dehydrogenase-like protein